MMKVKIPGIELPPSEEASAQVRPILVFKELERDWQRWTQWMRWIKLTPKPSKRRKKSV